MMLLPEFGFAHHGMGYTFSNSCSLSGAYQKSNNWKRLLQEEKLGGYDSYNQMLCALYFL
jgi:hypothetical protein